jgi:hypothetical protein
MRILLSVALAMMYCINVMAQVPTDSFSTNDGSSDQFNSNSGTGNPQGVGGDCKTGPLYSCPTGRQTNNPPRLPGERNDRQDAINGGIPGHGLVDLVDEPPLWPDRFALKLDDDDWEIGGGGEPKPDVSVPPATTRTACDGLIQAQFGGWRAPGPPWAVKSFLGGSLIIGTHRVRADSDTDYLGIIRCLTVPPERQRGDAWIAGDVERIKAELEDPLRRQIFDAMYHHKNEFEFQNLTEAKDNFAIRVEAIGFMRRIGQGQVNSDYYDAFPENKPYIGPDVAPHSKYVADSVWEVEIVDSEVNPYVFSTKSGKKASVGVAQFRTGKSRIECLTAIELTILHAVEKVIGAGRFDDMHKNGLRKVGQSGSHEETSILQHTAGIHAVLKKDPINPGKMRPSVALTVADMVPGDWVYMANKWDYAEKTHGNWIGENALYMGKYKIAYRDGTVFDPEQEEDVPSKVRVPLYDKGAPARFSGLGQYDKTEARLREKLKGEYNTVPQLQPVTPAEDDDIFWTRIVRLVAEKPMPSKTPNPNLKKTR